MTSTTPPPSWTFGSLEVPPLIPARRLTGLVATTIATATEKQKDTVPPQFLRQQSMSGNVLLLENDNNKAFLLQRKLEQQSTALSSNESYSVRVGYPLYLPLKGHDEKESSDDHHDTSLDSSKRIWSVQENAPLVAIYVYSMSTTGTSTMSPTYSALPNPWAEWHVWNKLRHVSHLFVTGDVGCDQTLSTYYGITPWHATSLWEDLCERGRAYSEAEAATVFGQLTQILQQLQTHQLWHRHVTLHTLVLVDDEMGDSSSSTGWTSKRPRLEAPKATQCAIKLSKHGWALPVGVDTTTTTTNRIPPPPCTIPPMYVAPEWFLWSSSETTTEPMETQNDNQSNPQSLYALDIWSVGICLLTLLVGPPPSADSDSASSVKSLWFAAPIPEDPNFVQLHTRLDKWYGKLWSPELLQLLHGLLQVNPHERWSLEQVLQHQWGSKSNTATTAS